MGEVVVRITVIPSRPDSDLLDRSGNRQAGVVGLNIAIDHSASGIEDTGGEPGGGGGDVLTTTGPDQGQLGVFEETSGLRGGEVQASEVRFVGVIRARRINGLAVAVADTHTRAQP